MKRIFFISLIFTTLYSCIQNRQKEECFAQCIVDINNPVKISIEEFVTDIDTIRLEVTKESLIKDIIKMHIMDNKFYILTNNKASIFVFDSKGKYLSKINDKGNGPKEYISIGSFEIDPVNEKIIVADYNSKKILVYDKDGKQLDVMNLDFNPNKIVPFHNGFINVYSGIKHFYSNPEMENYNLHFLDSLGKFIFSANMTETPNGIFINPTHAVYCLDNGDVLFHPVLGNIIYKISTDSIRPYYAFNNLSKYKLLTKEDKKKFKFMAKPDGKNYLVEKENEGYLLTWGSVLELTDFTFFCFDGWNKKCYLYYSKKTSKTILIESENVTGEKNFIDIFMSAPEASKENKLYISPSFSLINTIKSNIKDEKLKTFFENTDFDSNPVIISFSINFPE